MSASVPAAVTPLRYAAGLGLAVVAAVAVTWHLKPGPTPLPPGVRTVTVHDTVAIYATRPRDPGRESIPQRLTTHTVDALLLVTSQLPQDSARRNQYVAAALEVDSLRLRGAPPESLPTPRLPPFAGRYQGTRLTLYATRSDGTAWTGEYRAHTPLEFGVDPAGQPFVRERRGWTRLGRGLVRCVGAGALGGLVGLVASPEDGALRGAVVGGAIGCTVAVTF